MMILLYSKVDLKIWDCKIFKDYCIKINFAHAKFMIYKNKWN